MINKNLLFFVLFFSFIMYGQRKDRIYRVESELYDAVGYSFWVNILTLQHDNRYNFVEQKYISKKFAKKNIIFKSIKSNGNWNVSNDTLKLIDNENKSEMVFLMRKNYLIYLFDNVNKSNLRWAEIKY